MFRPRNIISRYANSVSVDEAVRQLKSYLADEIEVVAEIPKVPTGSHKTRKRARTRLRAKMRTEKAANQQMVKEKRKKQNGNIDLLPSENLSEMELVLASMALISSRIIAKYSKSQQPHYERMLVWERSIRILGELVSSGGITPGEPVIFAKNEYTFDCVLYQFEAAGKILMPMDIPKYQPEVPDSKEDYQPLRFENLDKAQARKYILEYPLQASYSPQKWSFTYIVKCADGTYYTDTAHDVGYAVHLHCTGRGSPYTKSRAPVKLCYWKAFSSMDEAESHANGIRRLSRDKKRKVLIIKR